jgi:hypothetical protein
MGGYPPKCGGIIPQKCGGLTPHKKKKTNVHRIGLWG